MRTIYMHPGQNLPPAAAPAVAQQTAAAHNRVMSDHLGTRLAVLNSATRALRERGLRILRQELNLHIASGPAALVEEDHIGALDRLLASGECKGRQFHTVDGVTTAFTVYRGVIVSWKEKCHG